MIVQKNGNGTVCGNGRAVLLGALAVIAVCFLLNDARLWRPDAVFTAWENNQIAEAEAWLNGRLHLNQQPDQRRTDTAVYNGKVYSHFPPLFTLIALPFVALSGAVPHWAIVLLFLPIPILAYALLYRLTRSPGWAAVLAVGLVCGTSLWPVLTKAIKASDPYRTNHVLASIGLLILLLSLTGRKHYGWAVVGLMIAAFSRQLTTVYLLPVLHSAMNEEPSRRGRALVTSIFGTVMVLAVPMTLNALKFGSPFDSGYLRIYEDRDDRYAMDARTHGVFSAHFIPRNLYYLNMGLPRLHTYKSEGEERWALRHQTLGTGIWWTTPLLLWLFFDIRPILRDRSNRMWLVSVGLVAFALLCFHATGSDQRGYNRFSLDFVPVLYYLLAPRCLEGRRRWITVAMIVWSVIYFRWLI